MDARFYCKHHEFTKEVERLIRKEKYSPYAAIEDIKRRGGFVVSLSTLYRYIDRGYCGKLNNAHLPEKMKRKTKAVKAEKRRPHYLAGLSIEQRPLAVLDRSSPYHLEMDTVIGGKGSSKVMLVFSERMSRMQAIRCCKDKTANTIQAKARKVIRDFKPKTITCDNGSEFYAAHEMEKYGKCKVYFCHPFCASERGTNENQNRLIRRWWPKGKSFADLTQKERDRIASWMNNYPRKILGGKTPLEVYTEHLQK